MAHHSKQIDNDDVGVNLVLINLGDGLSGRDLLKTDFDVSGADRFLDDKLPDLEAEGYHLILV